MSGMKVPYNDLVAKGRAPVKLEQALQCIVVVVPLLSSLEMRVLHSNQGLNRAYDVTRLPVMCLDMHVCTT